ncbi:MAG: hypothetical protein ACTSPM_01285 [Candidatus Heimdallarchaeota archaeon]
MTERKQTSEIGIAVVMMTEAGPETHINNSNLDEVAQMYLAVKGFTAFMTGFEREEHGPGKIRGILQIPSTENYAIAFDHNMKGIGTEQDHRMRVNRMGIICLITTQKELDIVRRFYLETEHFLAEKLQDIFSIVVLTEKFIKTLTKKYNSFIQSLLNSVKNFKQPLTELQSLFDITILLALPQDENLTARAIMDIMTNTEKQGATLKDICAITKRNKRKELVVLDKLIIKGLVIVIPHEDESKEILYKAN